MDVLIGFLNLFLEYMLLTLFNFKYEGSSNLLIVLGDPAAAARFDFLFLDVMFSLSRIKYVMVDIVVVVEAVNILVAKIVPLVVPMVVLSRIVPIRGYESEGKWMSLFRDMIFCVFCINIALSLIHI